MAKKDIEQNDNAADQEAIKDKAVKQRNAQDQWKKDIRELLEVPAFRRFIWRMFNRFGLFRLSFTGNSETFFNEGRRNEGLWLLSEIAAADEKGVSALFAENASTLKEYGGI